MAMEEPSPAAPPSAEVVGNAFVEQYYHILHQSPGMVHRFYQDSSLLSRPDVNGVMTTVTTMKVMVIKELNYISEMHLLEQAINEKIMSLNYEDHRVEIKTADAQKSHENGVIVLVTGCLTGKDNARRKFSQTFFLAPQDNGYFVLNDVFRYVGESAPLLVNDTNENAPAAALVPEPGINDADRPLAEPEAVVEEDLDEVAEVCDPSDNEGSVVEDEAVEFPAHSAVESTPPNEEDAPKKSYASIVKVTQGNAASRPPRVPSGRASTGATDSVQQSAAFASVNPSASAASALIGENAPGSSNNNEEVEGHSIYIRNLPSNATVDQLEEEFRKFGSIKPNGIQVRSAKGSCFGFVEFESLTSMQSALEASPINIGGRQAAVEEKRTTTRVTNNNSGGGRGRYSGRGGFRSDSFRGRGNFGVSRGYGRSEFRNQGEFSGRPRGPSGRGVETYQRVNQNGIGRGGRQGGGGRTSAPSST